MSAINATPGDPAANCYLTEVEADAYFADRIAHAGWGAALSDAKRRALLQATRELDAYMEWLGSATSTTQALAFPRTGLLDPETGASVDSATIPARVKWATAEQAAALLSGDRASELPQAAQGLKRLTAGPVELEFRDGAPLVRQVVVSGAVQLVACWGRMVQPSLGGAMSLSRV